MMREFSDKYLAYLNGPLKGLNLTKILEEDEFYNKQIIDSIMPLEKSNVFKSKIYETKTLVDIGFGGGFPIIPLAYINPEVEFVGLEARQKKVDAVSKIRDYFEIKNVSLFHKRIENVLFNKESVITFKAVGKISKLLKMIKCTRPTYVFFYKGPNVETLEDFSTISKKKWELVENITFNVPGLNSRSFVGFKSLQAYDLKSNRDNNLLVKLTDIFNNI